MENSIQYLAETEKAVLLGMQCAYRDGENRVKKEWFPKSQLTENGLPKFWIIKRKVFETNGAGLFECLIDKAGVEYSYEHLQA